MAQRDVLSCSFCLRPSTEVERLLGGPGAYICDGCVGAVSYTHLTLPTNREV